MSVTPRVATILLSLLLIGFLSYPRISFAQAPEGTYTQTCRDISINNRTLSANCKDRGGNYRLSSLSDYGQCIGNVANDDGVLRCNRGRKPPKGSYQDTCEVSSVDELGGLRSTCKDRSGKLLTTYLGKFEECIGNIFNDNGTLRCSKTPVVGGPYSKTCDNITMNGASLRATCKKLDGKLVATSLDNVGECKGAIENINGALDCIKGGGAFPLGSYRATCIHITTSASSLSADCVSINGSFQRTTLDATSCRGETRNVDGVLTCNKGSGAAPSGNYQQTCRNVVVQGSLITASCRRANGGYLDASLEASGCSSNTIQNVDGRLTCTAATESAALSTTRKKICAADQPPVGWIIVDTNWDPTSCGSPAGVTQNVLTIVKYDQLSVGTKLQVCSGQSWQSNWSLLGKSWRPNECGRPTTPADNVSEIQRKS